ncbi:MAG: monoglucosyldiacylglycerol [Erysipelotrichaceae bacterium]|nr:MAG: monoglucosyldiacylglycerol [Erysipelotrichaceae bacterium]
MKISINMLSNAESVEGQGVGSAYAEMVALLIEGTKDLFDITINGPGDYDINHIHTIEPIHFIKLKSYKGVNVMAVHFLPDTLEGSINLPQVAFSALKFYVTTFYKGADYLIVVNPTFKKELVNFGIEPDKIHYIPNYVSKEHFYTYDAEKRAGLRANIGIKPEDFVVIGVGQVQHRKGVLDFIEVAKQCPDIQFIWCGGFSFGMITDGYFELKEIVENPPKNVKFLGIIPREQMNDMYNISDVLFMPSYNELFPMSILEACNLRKPILLRNLDLYKDILFDHCVRGENNQDFTDLLHKLKNDPDFYKTAEGYSDFVAQYYSKEHVLSQWVEFYKNIYHASNIQDEIIKITFDDFNKIINGKKRMLIIDDYYEADDLHSDMVNITLSVNNDQDFAVEVKAVNIRTYEDLDSETALELILQNQPKLSLSAKEIYKYSKKETLMIMEFEVIKDISLFSQGK